MNSAENKNLVLAMVLMLAVWLGFSFFFPPQKEQQPEGVQITPVAASQAKEETVVNDKVAEVETLPASGETPDSVTVQTSASAREITVETDKYQAVFTTEGARLISFKLKEYMATSAKTLLLYRCTKRVLCVIQPCVRQVQKVSV